MVDTPDEIRARMEDVASRYNSFLELLQLIADEKGDDAASDPDYIQYYNDATALNEQYEALQAQLDGAELADPPAIEDTVDAAIEAIDEIDALEPDVPSHTISPDLAPVGEPDGLVVEAGSVAMPPASAAADPAVPPVEVVETPPEPAYVTVERSRVELQRVHEQSWSFVGIASSIAPAVADLASKGGFITENVLEGQFGQATFLLPFPVENPVGMMVSQVNKKVGKVVGMIYYPNKDLTPQAITGINQVMQALLVSKAPRNHVVVLVKPASIPSATGRLSIITGGLSDQDAKFKQALEAKFGQGHVYFDNDIFFKGQLLEELKGFASKVGLRLVTLVCSGPVLHSFEHVQALVESFS